MDACNRTQEALLEHPPWEPEVDAHCGECQECEALRSEVLRLRDSAREWRDQTPGPPLNLRRRIERRLRTERDAAPRSPQRQGGIRRRLAWMAVAAAMVLLAVAILFRPGAPDAGDGPEAALASARKAYVAAIARLEREADAVLARAADPRTSPRQAAILIGYRDRLAYLDEVIAEVNGFLIEHPGHAGGHTVLLAAYREKAEVLEQVLDLAGDRS